MNREPSNGDGTTAAPAANPRPARRREGGVIVPHQPSLLQRLGGTALFLTIRAVAATTRFRLVGNALAASQDSQACIFAIWHNRLPFCLVIYQRFVQRQHQRRRMAAIVSASRDGGFLSTLLRLFRVEPVRGSSSRRGPQALRELVTWGERGYDLAITPDGPRGPRYVVQEGTVALAQLTGLPVVPASYRLSRKFELKSWDRFQVPLPFGRCDVHIGKPVLIPRDATDAEREAARQKIETTLRELAGD